DVGGVAPAGARRGGARVSRLVRAVPVRQREGAVLRGPAGAGSGAGARQPWGVHLRGDELLPAHGGQGAAAAALGAGAARGGLHGIAAGRADDGCVFTRGGGAAGEGDAVRPVAGVDQPRGILGEADALVLGRLLGAQGP